MNLIPIVLAGGSGTRLWPLSRKNFPKQFLRLNGEQSLLQQTMERIKFLPHESSIIVSNEAHYFLCQEQLHHASKSSTYILEPCARNTAPAIASAAHHLMAHAGPDALMIIIPADHYIADNTAWAAALLHGASYALEQDCFVTFGIKPTSPKTGYGYIETFNTDTTAITPVRAFREKPDESTAKAFLKTGGYYWNSGLFVCKARVYLDELEKFSPDIVHHTKIAYDQAYCDHDYLRLQRDAFANSPADSIDYAIMEKTDKAVVMPLNIAWSDLGCWSAVAEANPIDEQRNVLRGNVIAKDCNDCFLSSETTLLTALGIQNQIIVATGDAVLVADKTYSQQVKAIVDTLGYANAGLAHDHVCVARPWGTYEVLAEGATFKVKRLMVKPGAKLSLQKHLHRAEHWVVVSGIAEVINDDQAMRLSVNQSTYIPKQTLHRLSNHGTEPLYVIEVQSGDYLGEDDIVRYEDIYARADLTLS